MNTLQNKKILIIRESNNGNYLVTLAIGDKYLTRFENTVLNSWITYADRHGLGIIVIKEDLISFEHKKWKKAPWQKLLLGSSILKVLPQTNLLCYLDTDVLINPFAPNIFDKFVSKKIGVVSLRNGIPFDYFKTLRRVALLRHTYLDSSYPLDSALFFNLETLYTSNNLEVQNDEFCSGLLLFKASEFAEVMEKWFHNYDRDIKTTTNNGEQTHLNYHVLSNNLQNYLEYEYQAIWTFEVANYYSLLFKDKFRNTELFNSCVESTLLRVHFLHFAGNWTENSKFLSNKFSFSDHYLGLYSSYNEYSNVPLTGYNMGTIWPKIES